MPPALEVALVACVLLLERARHGNTTGVIGGNEWLVITVACAVPEVQGAGLVVGLGNDVGLALFGPLAAAGVGRIIWHLEPDARLILVCGLRHHHRDFVRHLVGRIVVAALIFYGDTSKP